MNDGPKPEAVEFFCDADGSVFSGNTNSWFSSTVMRVVFEIGPVTPTNVRCWFSFVSSSFASDLGEVVTPFTIDVDEV